MTKIWALVDGKDLCVGDLVRAARSYQDEEFETTHRDAWSAGMPEVLERWVVDDVTSNGWITLTQERRPEWERGLDGKRRWGLLFEETGEQMKVRGRKTKYLVAITSGDHRWAALGLEGVTPRRPEQRMPASRA